MRGQNRTPVRTVLLPYTPDPALLRALHDVRSAVSCLLPDWRAHPDESRFEATRRSYRELRPRYAHLASGWSVAACNEAHATLRAWDQMLRRARRHNPAKFERLRALQPRRSRLKVSLPRYLYRIDRKSSTLDITLRPDHHVRIDLSGIRNPLFHRYWQLGGGEFGLAITDRFLIFNFRVPHEQPVVEPSAGIDLNMPSADFATSDGILGSVDLTEITRVQGAMARKREKVQRAIPMDLRGQRKVLRRYRHRERNRVAPLLYRAVNELLKKVGDRNLILEDLSETTEELLQRRGGAGRSGPAGAEARAAARRRLSVWTHGALQRIISYKSHTAVMRVNPKGTSSTCPQCGGVLHHPSWRRSDCDTCQNSWHRDRAAAIVILDRGLRVLRGAALPPSARTALREAAAWRPGVDDKSTRTGLTAEPRTGDDAKDLGLM